MSPFKVHIVHVGHMGNKGTQALLASDVFVIRDLVKGEVEISVSTTDIEGTRNLGLGLLAVTAPLVDIPYEKADAYAKKLGFSRKSVRYKVFALAVLYYMFTQVLFSAISASLLKANLRVFYRAESLKRIKECDLVVSCSDENFKEGASVLPLNVYWILIWWSMLVSRLWKILVVKHLGKPVVMFPNSVGPFRTFVGRLLSKAALNSCDAVLVREPVSDEIVRSLKIRAPTILTSDTTLLFNSRNIPVKESSSSWTVGVSPGVYAQSLSEKEVRRYIVAHARALDAAIRKHSLSVVFLPHYISGFRLDDLDVCKLILAQMEHKKEARIIRTDNAAEFRLLIGQTDMIISSKMHPAVLAASCNVPALFIAYDHKQTGFLRSLGMQECGILISEVSERTLSSKIDHVWNKRDELRALLKRRIPEMQEHVKQSISLVMSQFVKQD